jgi:hypothetical protein
MKKKEKRSVRGLLIRLVMEFRRKKKDSENA